MLLIALQKKLQMILTSSHLHTTNTKTEPTYKDLIHAVRKALRIAARTALK